MRDISLRCPSDSLVELTLVCFLSNKYEIMRTKQSALAFRVKRRT